MQTNIKQDYCSYDNQLMYSMGPGLYKINTPGNDQNVCSQDITHCTCLRTTPGKHIP